MPNIENNEIFKTNTSHAKEDIIELSGSPTSNQSQQVLSSDSDVEIISSQKSKDEDSESDNKSTVEKLNGITEVESIFYVEKILDSKITNGKRLFLLKWEGYSNAENTWEPEENVNSKDLIDEYLAMEELKQSSSYKQIDDSEAIDDKQSKLDNDIVTVDLIDSEEKTEDKPLSEQSLFDRIPAICISRLPINANKPTISVKISTDSLTRQQSVSIIENADSKLLKQETPENSADESKDSIRLTRSATIKNVRMTRSSLSKRFRDRKLMNTSHSSKRQKTSNFNKKCKRSRSNSKESIDSDKSPPIKKLRSRDVSIANSIDSSKDKNSNNSEKFIDVSSKTEDNTSIVSSENSQKPSIPFRRSLRNTAKRLSQKQVEDMKLPRRSSSRKKDSNNDTKSELSLRSRSIKTMSNKGTISVADSLDSSNLKDDEDNDDIEDKDNENEICVEENNISKAISPKSIEEISDVQILDNDVSQITIENIGNDIDAKENQEDESKQPKTNDDKLEENNVDEIVQKNNVDEIVHKNNVDDDEIEEVSVVIENEDKSTKKLRIKYKKGLSVDSSKEKEMLNTATVMDEENAETFQNESDDDNVINDNENDSDNSSNSSFEENNDNDNANMSQNKSDDNEDNYEENSNNNGMNEEVDDEEDDNFPKKASTKRSSSKQLRKNRNRSRKNRKRGRFSSNDKTREEKANESDDNLDHNVYFPDNLTQNVQEIFQVEKILRMRTIGKKRFFLLKWEGFPDSENTWEPEDNLECPDLIEDFLLEMTKRNSLLSAAATVKNARMKNYKGMSRWNKKKFKKSMTNEPANIGNIETRLKRQQTHRNNRNNKRKVSTGYSSPEELDEEDVIVEPFMKLKCRGKVRAAERIIAAGVVDGRLMFLIKWKNKDLAHLVDAKRAYSECPQVCLRFYHERIFWRDQDGDITDEFIQDLTFQDDYVDKTDTTSKSNTAAKQSLQSILQDVTIDLTETTGVNNTNSIDQQPISISTSDSINSPASIGTPILNGNVVVSSSNNQVPISIASLSAQNNDSISNIINNVLSKKSDNDIPNQQPTDPNLFKLRIPNSTSKVRGRPPKNKATIHPAHNPSINTQKTSNNLLDVIKSFQNKSQNAPKISNNNSYGIRSSMSNSTSSFMNNSNTNSSIMSNLLQNRFRFPYRPPNNSSTNVPSKRKTAFTNIQPNRFNKTFTPAPMGVSNSAEPIVNHSFAPPPSPAPAGTTTTQYAPKEIPPPSPSPAPISATQYASNDISPSPTQSPFLNQSPVLPIPNIRSPAQSLITQPRPASSAQIFSSPTIPQQRPVLVRSINQYHALQQQQNQSPRNATQQMNSTPINIAQQSQQYVSNFSKSHLNSLLVNNIQQKSAHLRNMSLSNPASSISSPISSTPSTLHNTLTSGSLHNASPINNQQHTTQYIMYPSYNGAQQWIQIPSQNMPTSSNQQIFTNPQQQQQIQQHFIHTGPQYYQNSIQQPSSNVSTVYQQSQLIANNLQLPQLQPAPIQHQQNVQHQQQQQQQHFF